MCASRPAAPPGPAPPVGASWPRATVIAGLSVAAALALRLWTLAAMEASNPLFAEPILDEQVYLGEVTRFADGVPPSDAGRLLSRAWPLVLRLAGVASEHGAALVNVSLGSLTAGLAAYLAARLAGATAGLVAGGLVAGWGTLVFYDVTTQMDPLLTLCTTAAILGMAAAARRPGPRRLALAGALVAAAAACRATSVVLLAGTATTLRTNPVRRGLLLASGLAVGLTLYGLAAGTMPVGGALNIWLGNNAWSRETRSFGTDEFWMHPVDQATAVRRIAERAAGRELDAAAVNAYWARRAWNEMRAAPLDAVEHLAVKAVLVLGRDEIGSVHDAVVERGFAPWTAVVPVSGAWLLVLGAAGWGLARRRAVSADATALAAAAFLASVVLVFPLGRYRAPILPAAAVLAGLGVHALRGCSRGDVRRAVLAGGLTLAAALAAPLLRPTCRPESWTNLGLASLRSGVGDPVAPLLRAIEEDADWMPSRVLVAEPLLDAGRVREALYHLEVAAGSDLMQRDPDLALRTGRLLPRALLESGRPVDALRAHDEFVARLPHDPDLLAEGPHLALAAGRRDEARRRLTAALRVAPSHPRVTEAERLLDR